MAFPKIPVAVLWLSHMHAHMFTCLQAHTHFLLPIYFFAGEGDRDACMSHRAHVEVRWFSGSLRAPMWVPETEICLASLVAGACFYLLSHLATPTHHRGASGSRQHNHNSILQADCSNH